MDAFINKLESSARLQELSPKATLLQLGLTSGQIFCDIGAGTGIFTFAAREITEQVFSLEMSEALLEYMQKKAARLQYGDITFVKTTSSHLGMPAQSCDVALLCTVLHELDDAPTILLEIRQILKKGGFLGIIEFHKKPTPMGPPVYHRIAEKDSVALAEGAGLFLIRSMRLGENFYLQIFSKDSCA